MDNYLCFLICICVISWFVCGPISVVCWVGYQGVQTVQCIILQSPPPYPFLQSKEYTRNPSLVLFMIMSKGYTRNPPCRPPLLRSVKGIYQESQPGPFISDPRNIPGILPWTSLLRFKEYTRNSNLVLLSQVQGIYQESLPGPLISGSRNILGIPTWSSTQVQGIYQKTQPGPLISGSRNITEIQPPPL